MNMYLVSTSTHTAGCRCNCEQYKPYPLQRIIALPGHTDETTAVPRRAMMQYRRDSLGILLTSLVVRKAACYTDKSQDQVYICWAKNL